MGLMKRRELVNLLADHADALNHADGDDASWLNYHAPLPPAPSLLTLLQLARAVQRVLVPVTPSPLFQAALKDQLVESELSIEKKRPFPKTIWLGTAVSVVGLTLYLLRRFRPGDDGVGNGRLTPTF